MPRIIAKPDNLNERNSEFSHQALKTPVFLNSVPKSGSHLMKNIFRMFVPLAQHYGPDFIQFPTLKTHHEVFIKDPPRLSWGHLLFADSSALLLKNVYHILLVRDPYDWVLARARFFLSDNFQANLEHLKNDRCAIDDFLNMMIFGIYQKVPTMREIYENNAAAWLGTSARIVRFEDLLAAVKDLGSKSSETFFRELFEPAGIELPKDWKTRIEIGADRKQSGTARENLSVDNSVIPKSLPKVQKQLVDFAAPGLRELLGYT